MSPWAVLGVILARVVTHTPPNVVLPAVVGGLGSINMFVGLCARSGGGKGAAISVGSEALETGRTTLRIARANLGSGEGISASFVSREKDETGEPAIQQHTDSVLFEVAEVDTFGAVSNRTGSTLMPEVRKLWSGEALGFQNRDAARTLPVEAHTYRAAMIVGVQPTRSGALLGDADGGTPQRFLWMPATDPEAPDRAPTPPAPLRWVAPGEDVLPTIEGKRVMAVCSQAWEAIDTAQIARLRGDGEALDGHALFSRLKVAAALSLFDGRGDVTEEDWDLAGTVMVVSDRTRQECRDALSAAAIRANEARAEARAEASIVVADHTEVAALARTKTRVLTVIGSEWMSSSEIHAKVTTKLRPHLERALSDLLESGTVAVVRDEYNGRERVRYRLEQPSALTKSSGVSRQGSDPHQDAEFSDDGEPLTNLSGLTANRHLVIVHQGAEESA